MNEKLNRFLEEGTYSYVALGSFDGLHSGHLSLVNKIIELANENKGRSIVYTFKNHPRTLIKGTTPPKLLMDNESKEEILESLGVDLIYFEEFNEEYMKLTPEGFIKYLCEKFKVKGIVVGFNYRFGYKNIGNIEMLKELSTKYGYELYVMEPCNYENEVISSTRIRNELFNGNVDKAMKMLNRPYIIKGKVVHGKKLGRTIGFPTANLDYSKEILIPSKGVYYTNVEWQGKIYKGITSVGNNPTVNGNKLTIETYILDFNNDLYGHNIKVYFIKKIRDEKKFNSIDDLVIQLKKDKNYALEEKFFVNL
ncbi:MAG: bifunctional riboflavin kinase/FAD synthetase [Clostridium sp.]|uniref:Riboflavin biosynthesis protein n=1 Tax=Clostridium paraputrificum TaxID=29363 RepID=A0A6N2YXA0_9CLOT|nr:bifunctional riboflavin kinase/FAD synthetase [Clostridium sp.]MBS5927148.1 bifunctional riboflavin kinase/FAD synthetase [Clostridium sp.]MBS5987580.1 bifunctional riboflavin kinase/FAD synthetase [Clostridium sp.]